MICHTLSTSELVYGLSDVRTYNCLPLNGP